MPEASRKSQSGKVFSREKVTILASGSLIEFLSSLSVHSFRKTNTHMKDRNHQVLIKGK
ncbi:unnamed protein product [Amoebophrya sp. A25]|nr:unnamed protein product [Amoebophrya sp. A25]|eukprot:GSA25T00010308001.1